MIHLIKMAFRDLGRNRRRSFFSALALGMGLSLLLLMASVIEGEVRSSMDLSIKLQSGHLQVRSLTYDEDKHSLAHEDLVADPESVAAQIAALEPVQAASPRLYASGILTVGEQTAGVNLLGIDPNSDTNAPYRDGIVSGQYLSADDRQGVLIGSTLAANLGLSAGDAITVMVNTANGDVDEQPFTIRGTYATGSPFYDESTLIMPLAKAQTITQAEGYASTIFVLLKDQDQADAVSAALKSSQYEVLTYQQMNALLAQIQGMSNGYMIILYLIVLGITATVIVNTLIMSVFERTREIGILAAMGMRPGRIMAMFFTESALLTVGGTGIGLALGGLLVMYASKVGFYIGKFGIEGMLLSDRIYARLTAGNAIALIITAFVVSLLAALYPALLAARLEPVDALHSGN